MDLSTLTCRAALKAVAKIIHQLHDEGKDKPFELELSWLCEESGWAHQHVPKAVADEAEAAAKAELDEDDEDEDE